MINKYIKHILILTLLSMGLDVRAQQDPQFSQYMFNLPYFIPALTGADERSNLTVFSRSQWLGYDASFDQEGGAPNTQFISYQMPLTLLNVPVGVGVNVIYDETGPLSNIYFQPAIAYSFDFPRGSLKVGLRPSINNQRLDFSTLEFVDPNDVRNTGEQQSQVVVDLDAGVAYSAEDFMVGLGVSHILQPTYDFQLEDVNGAAIKTAMVYSAYGEYDYFVNTKLSLTPSALVQTDINAFSYNIGVIAGYSEKMWGGLSFRDRESLVLILGYAFFENRSLQVGYSFDYVVNDQEAKANSSHELHLKYYLPGLSTGTKKIIRTPRFRF